MSVLSENIFCLVLSPFHLHSVRKSTLKLHLKYFNSSWQQSRLLSIRPSETKLLKPNLPSPPRRHPRKSVRQSRAAQRKWAAKTCHRRLKRQLFWLHRRPFDSRHVNELPSRTIQVISTTCGKGGQYFPCGFASQNLRV